MANITEEEALKIVRELGMTPLEFFIAAAVRQYQQSAPKVAEWLRAIEIDLISEGGEHTTLGDIRQILMLGMDGGWAQPIYAQNRIYHWLDLMGRDTTGWSD